MGRPLHDITGERFGILTAMKRVANDASGNTIWRCRCDCGTVLDLQRSNLVGRQKSCGCLFSREHSVRMKTHGLSAHPLYNTWNQIRQRCLDKNNKSFQRYGGRGITICDRWRDDVGAFIADMWPKPTANHSIERIDNDKGYSPENCRWATPIEQNRNTRTNRRVTIKGETLTIAEWSERYSQDYFLVSLRIHRGWTPEEALATPPRKGNYRRGH